MGEFNLKKIFADVFGYAPPEGKYNDIEAKPPSRIINDMGDEYDDSKLTKKPDRILQSSLGQNYYASDEFNREFFLPISIDKVLIPFAVMSMTWKKTFVETPMPERGGSVNELISLDDYIFNIKGILVNDDYTYPEKQIITLRDLFLKNESVEMRSVLSDIILKGRPDIGSQKADDPYGHKVIIKDLAWPEVKGVEHVKPFEMNVKSDMVFELEVA